MSSPKSEDVRHGISVIWQNLLCPICLDLMVTPVSTKCDHQFCKFCMMKLLDRSKRKEAGCPVCKMKITKRTLQESPGFQKLVEGLKYLVQSYEFDTCTSYFTGMLQRRKHESIETESGDQEFRQDTHCSETEKPDQSEESFSSSAAAKDGFAQLMDLGDSFPGSSESCEDDTASLEKKKEKDRAKGKRQTDRINDRRKTRSTLMQKPEGIVDIKQKRGVDKVSEWLLKTSTSIDSETRHGKKNKRTIPERIITDPLLYSDIESEKNNVCSLVPTVNRQTANNEQEEVCPKRDDSHQQLEKQVFGAVYKRGRKSSKEFLPRKDLASYSFGLADEVDQTDVEKPEEHSTHELEKLKTAEVVRSDAEEKQDINIKNSPVFEMSVQKPRSKLISKMQDDFQCCNDQNVKDDKRSRKRLITRNSVKNVKDQNKNAKKLKSLTLVNAETEISVDLCNSARNLKAVETEDHIETFPSNEEPQSETRLTRRSLRLQVFTEEVQRTRRKIRPVQVPEDSTVSSENILVKTSNRDNADDFDANATSVDAEQVNVSAVSPQSWKMVPDRRKNGCVYHSDLGGVENVVACVEGGQLSDEMSVVQGEQSAPCTIKVVSTMAVVPLLEKHQDDSTVVAQLADNTSASSAVICARKSRCVDPEKEDDTYDSEQDTEQLMKSFKTTKRKSFYLDRPNSCGNDVAQPSNYFQPRPPEAAPQKYLKSFGNACRSSTVHSPDKPTDDRDCQNSSLQCSAISESLSAGSNCPQNSGLPGNSEAVDSLLLFPVLNATEDEIQDQSCVDKQPPKSSSSQPKSLEKNQELCQSMVNMPNSAQHGNSLESSITPDGLITGNSEPSDNLLNVEKDSGDGISPLRVRRTRRAQRLKDLSDSELSANEDSLPSMSQIFKCHPLHSSKSVPGSLVLNQDDLQTKRQRTNSGSGSLSQHCHSNNHPESVESELCPSQRQTRNTETHATVYESCAPLLPHKDDHLTSSQGSVDLFGTPDEYAVDGISSDAKLSVDASQYEIINTQQKIEMQEELRRLERMMDLVSKALREKESDCGSITADPSASQAVQHSQHSGHYTTRGSQKSLSDAAISSQRLGLRSCVKAQDFTSDESTKPRHGHKAKGVQKAFLTTTTNTKTTSTDTSCRVGGLVASGLSTSELSMVKKFARKMGCSLTKEMTPNTTHIIIKTDNDLVCERTFKYFQGIAGRKWVVSFQWVSECFKQGKVLDEAPFEVCGDVVNGNNHKGPMKARTTTDDNLLMKGYEICFHGSFTHMSRGQMEVLVEMCGASFIRDPLMFSRQGKCQFVVVQPSSDDVDMCYSALHQRAAVVSRGWLLDSIATYTVQNPENYKQ